MRLAGLILLLTLLFEPARADAGAPVEQPYLIQPGDVLDVSVWREPDLQRELLVRPDGGVSFPLAGDLRAAGSSVSDLETLLVERLGSVIPEPVVTVSVRAISGNRIFVLGKVARPGEFQISRPLDVLQALSLAGGTTPFASVNNIRVLRRVDGRLESIPFRYAEVESGSNLQQVITLEAGDTVLVP